MSEKYRKMEEKYTDVCQMFGEDAKKVEPSEFFKYFQDFVAMYFVSVYKFVERSLMAMRMTQTRMESSGNTRVWK